MQGERTWGSEEGSDVVMGAVEKPGLPGHPRTQRRSPGLPGPEDPGFTLVGTAKRSQEAGLHGPPGWSGHQRPLT